MHRSLLLPLKGLLAAGFAVCLLMQVWILPWLAATYADEEPDLAGLRWPVLLICIAGLLAVELVVVATWRLLDAVAAGRIFDAQALRWVDRIIGALAVGTVLAGVLLVIDVVAAAGPLSVPVAFLLVTAAGLGSVLLMIVMRGLLRQATDLRSEMDAVI